MTEIGHNSGASMVPTNITATIDDISEKAKRWKQAGVNDEAQAMKLTDFISKVRSTKTEADETRKAQRKPHDDAIAVIQDDYRPLLEALDRCLSDTLAIANDWTKQEQARLERERAKEIEQARSTLEKAERDLERAQIHGDYAGQAKAEAAITKAHKALGTTAKPKKAAMKSMSGGGRTLAARTVRRAEITDLAKALHHYRDEPEIAQLVEKLANRDIRAAKGKPVSIPGVTVTEEEKVV